MEDSGYILLVEDDPELRELMVDLLADRGYPVRTVGNGQEALAYLDRGGARPGLILLDDMMPVMSGRAFMDVIAERPALADLPVCLLTASADVRGSAARGTVAALQKPVDGVRLMDVVRRFLPGPD